MLLQRLEPVSRPVAPMRCSRSPSICLPWSISFESCLARQWRSKQKSDVLVVWQPGQTRSGRCGGVFPQGGYMALARILVVDDQPDIRRVLEEALRRFDFEVISAADGAEALRRFESDK